MKVQAFPPSSRACRALPTLAGVTDAAGWTAAAGAVAQAGDRLLALWASGAAPEGPLRSNATYAMPGGLVWLELPLAADDPAYPDLAALFPAAGRMQRRRPTCRVCAPWARPTPGPG